jgi:hypothetical protein
MIKNYFQANKGAIVVYIIVFGGIALMMLSGLLGYIAIQLRAIEQKSAWNESLNIAEAGIDYYRWCLNNGVEAGCIGSFDYTDQSGAIIGQYSIEVANSNMCGQTISRTITSAGRTEKFPAVKRTIRVVYARESVAKYSYVLNSNVWIGGDHEINGPYLSNGGIRMDGRNQSTVSSAAQLVGLPEFMCYDGNPDNDDNVCDSGCPTANGCRTVSGSRCICPAVFATTANPTTSLFKMNLPSFEFNSITSDLDKIKTAADTGGGIYLPKSKTIPGYSGIFPDKTGRGYHLVFKSDGTMEVYIVTSLGINPGDFSIVDLSPYATPIYTVPSACAAIYVEDNVWPEGVVKGKVTLAAANLIEYDNIDPDIYLNKDITYSSDSDDGLALIAEGNVLIGKNSENDLDLHAIMVAQKGKFGRNHYSGNFKNILRIYGSVISEGRVGTQWVNTWTGQIVSGYLQRYTYFDPNQLYNAPPFVAHTDPDFKIVNWREIN